MYFAVRNTPKAGQMFTWQDWRARRNNLFKHHQQSPLEEKQKVHFQALPYFDFDPDWRVLGNLKGVTNRDTYQVSLGEDGQFRFTRVAMIQFSVKNTIAELSLYWIKGYEGGLFLPFRDATNGSTTFGGGRYLFDTIKGADLEQKMIRSCSTSIMHTILAVPIILDGYVPCPHLKIICHLPFLLGR